MARPAQMTLEQYDPALADLLVDQSLRGLAKGADRKVLWRCADHLEDPRHVYPARVYNRTNTSRPTSCSICSGRLVVPGINDVATTHPDVAALFVDPGLATTLSAASNKVCRFRCSDPEHAAGWSAPVSRLTRQHSRCPHCSGRRAVAGRNDLATTHPALAAELADPSLATRLKAGSGQTRWLCPVPRHGTWSATVYSRTATGTGCPRCSGRTTTVGTPDHPAIVEQQHRPATRYPLNPSTSDLTPEARMTEVLRALLPAGTAIETSRRDLLAAGRELDVVVPDLRIAVEFNGVYWQSEALIAATDYHATKSAEARAAGYRLLHVWEDDWFERHALSVRALAHRLGATRHLLRALPDLNPVLAEQVHARALLPVEVDGRRARAFWTANHLQGPVGSHRYFGLVEPQQPTRLRALLGVGATNHGSRAKPVAGIWDVQRYATAGIVPGGFTRLLSHATRALRSEGRPVRTWTSYSNDDLSDGGMYQAAGFHVDRRQPPSYRYVGARTGWRRVHRSRYTRQRFASDADLHYEDGWTEHVAARANGLYRVYDAGKTRWIKDV